jgi:hypothetical protein
MTLEKAIEVAINMGATLIEEKPVQRFTTGETV